jgi:hypothetical protein
MSLPNPGGMPDWMWALFEPAMPPQKNAPWTPTFAPQQFVVEPTATGEMQQAIDITNFPTLETVQHIQAKYDPLGRIITSAYPGVGGPDQPSTGTLPPYFSLVWPNGVSIPAGVLAGVWQRNARNGQYDAADNICLELIEGAGAK